MPETLQTMNLNNKIYLYLIIACLFTSNNNILAQSESKLLDSTILYDKTFTPKSKEVFTYDQSGVNKTKTEGFYRVNGLWEKVYEQSYAFDEQNNLLSEKNDVLSISDESLSPYRYLFGYDGIGNIISEEFYVKDVNSEWIGNRKYSFTYAADKISEVVLATWNKRSANWKDSLIYRYAYDSNNNQNVVEVYEVNAAGRLMPSFKNEKVYSASNQLLSDVTSKGNQSQTAWAYVSKTEYTRAAGNLLLKKAEYVSADGLTWDNFRETTYSIDNTESITSLWNIQTDTWTQASKHTNIFLSGNLIGVDAELWDTNTNSWVKNIEKRHNINALSEIVESYLYDMDGNKIGLTRKTIAKDGWGNITSSINYAWHESSMAWKVKDRMTADFIDSNKPQTVEKSFGELSGSQQVYYTELYSYNDETGNLSRIDFYERDPAASYALNLNQYKVYYYNGESNSVDMNDDTISGSSLIMVSWHTDKISINTELNLSNVYVYTMTGKLCYQGKNKEISTSGWGEGAYLVKTIADNGYSKTAKILVR